ncbi:hypothetical protein BO71DRAFT_450356 [Aspergillus ellipticus CBS 707.79]|uniref:Uncharacterized protein n=1 Tax=Aspergillus ellipticus CBS 707.79 TaxID=1448320 RepID=A0A319D9K3_9EURO|nr:hypothetical protein BO71DRAFT_450356 [Aspergillus ellipticus CBS 707.79]
MLVNRDSLASLPYFAAMLRPNTWSESQPGTRTITVHEDHPVAMELLLRGLHDTLPDLSASTTSTTLTNVTIKDIWYTVLLSDKYLLDRDPLSAWVSSWTQAELKEPRQSQRGDKLQLEQELLFPAYAFDCAKEFQIVTRKLVYHGKGHLVERNPVEVRQLHLPARVCQQLNASRGRLRTILHTSLFEAVASLVSIGDCPCKELAVFEYLRELKRIEVWPLEDVMKDASISDILERLDDFDQKNMRRLKDEEFDGSRFCACSRSWAVVVNQAKKRVAEYFDGLCLDCMDKTKNLGEGGDQDDDYWHYWKRYSRYDSKCRIMHGQPTWYFSFMGRREKGGLVAGLEDEK